MCVLFFQLLELFVKIAIDSPLNLVEITKKSSESGEL